MDKIVVKSFDGAYRKETEFEDISEATTFYDSLHEDTSIKMAELSIVVKTTLKAFNR